MSVGKFWEEGHSSNSAHRGAWAEMIACTWLLENGYEVFRNVSATGPIDIIAYKDGAFYPIDVKMRQVEFKGRSIRVRGGMALTDKQQAMGVIQVYVTPDGVCGYNAEQLRKAYGAVAAKIVVDNSR